MNVTSGSRAACPMYIELNVQYCSTRNTMPVGDVTLAVTVKPPVYFVVKYYFLYFVHLK